jgi:lipopolysaccharide/colanic/teichoic acid biosynthesis glycosyltransferase
MRNRFLLSVLVSDLAALVVGLVTATVLVFDTAVPWHAHLPPGESLWPLLGLLGAGGILGSFASRRMWAMHVPRASYGRALAIVSFSTFFTATGLVVSRAYWSRPFVASTLFAWTLLAIAHRSVRRQRPWMEPMVLVTKEKGLVEDLAQTEHAEVLDTLNPAGEPPEFLDSSTVLVLDLRPILSDEMAQFISSWNLAGHPLRSLTNVYEEHTGRLAMVHLIEGWEMPAPIARNAFAPGKRIVDTLLVLATLPLWTLMALVIWVAVRIESSGPAIFRQTRIGKDGVPFTLYKFRTMVDGAEHGGPRFASLGDDRLTRVGRFLRRVHLDEVPQLWNVLRGDLSLVGPRPERPEFTEVYEATIPFYAHRHLVRPGVTGWAQVNYGYADDEVGAIEKLTFDLYYLKHMSPWLDAQILGSSIWTVLSGFGR